MQQQRTVSVGGRCAGGAFRARVRRVDVAAVLDTYEAEEGQGPALPGGGAPLAMQMRSASSSLTRTWLREWDRLSTRRQGEGEARSWDELIGTDLPRLLSTEGKIGGLRLA